MTRSDVLVKGGHALAIIQKQRYCCSMQSDNPLFTQVYDFICITLAYANKVLLERASKKVISKN